MEIDKPADNNAQDATVWIYSAIICHYFRSFLGLYLSHLISVNDEAAAGYETYTEQISSSIGFLRTGTVFSLKMVNICAETCCRSYFNVCTN